MKNNKGSKLTDSQFGILLAIPALAVFASVILYPVINSIIMSFTNQSLLYPGREFIGLQNYIDIFSDPNFFAVLKSTLIFVVGVTLLSFTLGFIWAILLNQDFFGSEFLRGITLVNWIIPGTAIGFLWMWIFNGQYGVLNAILKNLGIITNNISWLGNTKTAMMGVILARSWQVLPWFMALLLAGLKGIPKTQVEAARVDGASNWQIFRHIVLPNLKFIISLVLILGTIGAMQHFDIIWVMTEGGPARATTTFAVEVYRRAFQDFSLGKAATIGVVWIFILSGFMYLYTRNLKQEENV